VENLDDSGDINRAWENITRSVPQITECLGWYDQKQHESWFGEEASTFL
jgi:hypothetical protein